MKCLKTKDYWYDNYYLKFPEEEKDLVGIVFCKYIVHNHYGIFLFMVMPFMNERIFDNESEAN